MVVVQELVWVLVVRPAVVQFIFGPVPCEPIVLLGLLVDPIGPGHAPLVAVPSAVTGIADSRGLGFGVGTMVSSSPGVLGPGVIIGPVAPHIFQ